LTAPVLKSQPVMMLSGATQRKDSATVIDSYHKIVRVPEKVFYHSPQGGSMLHSLVSIE